MILDIRNYPTSASRIIVEIHRRVAKRLTQHFEWFMKEAKRGPPPWRRKLHAEAARFVRELAGKKLTLKPEYIAESYILDLYADVSSLKITADLPSDRQPRLKNSVTGEEYVIEGITIDNLPIRHSRRISFSVFESFFKSLGELKVFVPDLLRPDVVPTFNQEYIENDYLPNIQEDLTELPMLMTTEQSLQSVVDQLGEALGPLIQHSVGAGLSGSLALTPPAYMRLGARRGALSKDLIGFEYVGEKAEYPLTNIETSDTRIDLRAWALKNTYRAERRVPVDAPADLSWDQAYVSGIDISSIVRLHANVVTTLLPEIIEGELPIELIGALIGHLEVRIFNEIAKELKWKTLIEDDEAANAAFVEKVIYIVIDGLERVVRALNDSAPGIRLKADTQLLSNFAALIVVSIYTDLITNLKVGSGFIERYSETDGRPPVGASKLDIILEPAPYWKSSEKLTPQNCDCAYTLRNVDTNETVVLYKIHSDYRSSMKLARTSKGKPNKVVLNTPDPVMPATGWFLDYLLPAYRYTWDLASHQPTYVRRLL